MKLTILTGDGGVSSSDLVLKKLDKEDYYAVVSDPHRFFSRPSVMGDQLWEEYGFRCIRRKDRPNMKQIILSIDKKNMLILHLLFEDVEYKEIKHSWWDYPFKEEKLKFYFLPEFDAPEPAAKPKTKSQPRIRDWEPKNSVYPRKRG